MVPVPSRPHASGGLARLLLEPLLVPLQASLSFFRTRPLAHQFDVIVQGHRLPDQPLDGQFLDLLLAEEDLKDAGGSFDAQHDLLPS